jgi:hypothetical protein
MSAGTPRLGLLWGLLIAAPAATSVAADGDLWWHLLAGRQILRTGQLPSVDEWTYTAAGSPWVDHEWAPEIVTALAFDGGGHAGLLAVRALMLAVLVGAWLLTLRTRLPDDALCWVVAGLPLPMLAVLCNARPQTVTWMLVPVVLWLVDRVAHGRDWAPWALVATILLWVNLHGGFLFGWGVAGLGLLLTAAGLEGLSPTPRQRRDRLIAAALIAVSPVLNPYGLDLLVYMWNELGAPHPDLPEWNPPVGALRGTVVVAAAAPALVWLVHRGPIRPTAWVALLVATVAATQTAKFVALVIIVGAVCLADALGPIVQRRLAGHDGDELERLLHSTPFRLATLGLLMALHFPFVARPAGKVSVVPQVYPVVAMQWLAATESGGRLAIPLGWGGMAVYHLGPDWKVSLDGRNTTVFEVAEVVAQSNALIEGDPTPFLAGEPDAFLIHTDGALDMAMAELGGWERRFAGPTGVVWTREGFTLSEPADMPPPSGLFP